MAREIRIAIEGNQQEEIILTNSEGKQLTIKDNSTNAKALFEILDFEPGSKYEIDVKDAGKVKQKVFDEFVSLLEGIKNGVNGLLDDPEPQESIDDDRSDDELDF